MAMPTGTTTLVDESESESLFGIVALLVVVAADAPVAAVDDAVVVGEGSGLQSSMTGAGDLSSFTGSMHFVPNFVR